MTEMTRDDLDRIGATWVNRVKQAQKRDDRWIRAANRAEAAYLVDDEADAQGVPDFNILHANVETIRPNLYNSTPVPDIRSRHNAKDPLAKRGSDIIERCIATVIDDDKFDSEEEQTVLDAEISGRGVLRIRYDSDEDDMGQPVNETVLFENVAWRDYVEGDAKKWRDVPWVAFGHFISEDERQKIEDPEIAAHYADEDGQPENEEKTVRVWEIWVKSRREVIFVIEESQRVLSIKEDPLGLDGFFPMAAPIQPVTGSGMRTPVCPYAVYEKQAEELDRITRRIRALVSGLKVRGLLVGDGEDIERLAQAGDNELVPAGNIENLIAAGGIEKGVLWWPVETAVAVLRELFLQRDQVKQTIYEITGISDIVRGQSEAAETATAQEIKARAGGLRVKHRQRLVERHVRDTFQLAAELMAQMWSPQSFQAASGIQVDEQVFALLRDPMVWYRIDVETDSTIRADMTRDREEMTQFMAATGQFFQVMLPLAQQDQTLVEPISQIYGSFARQFNLGAEAEAALDAMVEASAARAQQPPQPSPEMQKLQADMAAKQAEMQLKQAEMDLKREEMEIRRVEAAAGVEQAEFQRKEATVRALADRSRARTERLKAEADLEMRQAELGAKMADMEERRQIDKARSEYDVDKAKKDYDAKADEISRIVMEGVAPVLDEISSRVAAQLDAQTRVIEQIGRDFAETLEDMTAAQAAPVGLIRENGRIVGAKRQYDGPRRGNSAAFIDAVTAERRLNGDTVQ